MVSLIIPGPPVGKGRPRFADNHNMTISLLSLPPSGNKYQRMHWAVKRDLRRKFAWQFRMEAGLCGVSSRPKDEIGKVVLGITAYRAGRFYDEDNFVAGLKPMIDGMRDAGYLRNDSPKWMELDPKPRQEKCGRDEERVEIVFREINDLAPVKEPA